MLFIDTEAFNHLFTFHYVSIKSPHTHHCHSQRMYLHSTMYLLNRGKTETWKSYISNLHSTMYLLNHEVQAFKVCGS